MGGGKRFPYPIDVWTPYGGLRVQIVLVPTSAHNQPIRPSQRDIASQLTWKHQNSSCWVVYYQRNCIELYSLSGTRLEEHPKHQNQTWPTTSLYVTNKEFIFIQKLKWCKGIVCLHPFTRVDQSNSSIDS